MRVKRYIVDSMPEAMEKIRIELGKDAIILNSKPIKTGGFLGMFSKQQIEVIAAVEEKNVVQPKAEAASKKEKLVATVPVPSAAQAYRNSGGGDSSIRTLEKPVAVEARTPSMQPTATLQLQPETVPPKTMPIMPVSSEQPLRTGQTTAVRPQEQPAALENQDLAQELRDMREMFRKLLLKGNDKHLPSSIAQVRDHLLEQEVEEELVSTIIADLLKRFEQPEETTEEEALQAAMDVVRARISKHTEAPARIERTAKCAFFFGPTGVGKTTTIAKLAAECMLKEKRKVGFITSDTFRIAAVEQLRTYANILNVPMEVVFSPGEIGQALEKLRHCDLILVDTAGRNYRNDEYVTAIKELLDYGETSVHYLVLSLTAKYSDMQAIASNFCDIPNARAIFTKADETKAYGPILNIVDRYKLALSYITTGQNVPDDIVLATPERVTKMIVGDDTYA
ncbi:MAG TPA: flagellar biosynthesis protein FlhF [Candidatus Bathyarchaeia archaeon]|nr:flagellar biosynthesis protein FlhF [Candidatus Bathyarchaeia archaeon]